MPLLNNCRFNTTTEGTGATINVGSAFSSKFHTPAEAGALDGVEYTWRADDGGDMEIFRAVYNSGTPDTLTGRTTLLSKISGVSGTDPLDLSGSASIRQVAAARDFLQRIINAQTGTTYDFGLHDLDALVTLTNGSPITATVLAQSEVAWPPGAQIDLVQLGAGQVTIDPDDGVTIVSKDSAVALSGQGAAGTLVRLSEDTWLLVGDID